MATKHYIKKDDTVVVIAGKYADKKASVISVDRDKGKVLVEGVNVVNRHTKPNQQNPDGGIVEKTLPIDISNVMLYCDSCKRGVRVGHEGEGRAKKRVCRVCGKKLDK